MKFSWFIASSSSSSSLLPILPLHSYHSTLRRWNNHHHNRTIKALLFVLFPFWNKNLQLSHNRTMATASASSVPSSCIKTTSMFQIVQFPCLGDNYGYLLHDGSTGETAAIDTPESKVYMEELEKRNWKLTHIFNHWDHVGGNLDLKSDHVKIYGPMNEKDKIPGIDIPLSGGDIISFGQSKGQIIDVGGHTKGHIAYYFPQQNVVFVGDSLFSLGCGRMFEGTPQQFWESLCRLRSLPDDTWIYCAHEYTASNAKFAISVEPKNPDLIKKVEQVRQLRENQTPTIPCLLEDEKKTNPFLRVDFSPEIRKNVFVHNDEDDATAFYKLRLAKDKF